MRGRILVLGAVLIATPLAGASFSPAASVGSTLDDTTVADERFLLSCTGAMATDGSAMADRSDPAGRIVASAMVDLAHAQVSGFGLGGSPIVVLTDAVIGFGSAAVDTVTMVAEPRTAKPSAQTGTVVEGTIDRATGATRIVVRPAADPARIVIAMTLDCVFGPAPR
jgi:hypothetical protein